MEQGDPLGKEFPTLEYFNQLVSLHQKYVAGNLESKPPVSMNDKIVIVGEFSTDTGSSPRSDQSPLVLLHANVLNNIPQNDYLKLANPKWVLGGALILSHFSLILLGKRSIILMALFTLVAVMGFVWLSFAAWIDRNLWIPLSAPLLGFTMLQFAVITQRVLIEQSGLAKVRAMFGSYVSPIVVNQMVASDPP
jgi:adenylate cyclase